MFNRKEPKKRKIIAKVRESTTGQKLVTIPKKAPVEDGDYVEIIKLEDLQ